MLIFVPWELNFSGRALSNFRQENQNWFCIPGFYSYTSRHSFSSRNWPKRLHGQFHVQAARLTALLTSQKCSRKLRLRFTRSVKQIRNKSARKSTKFERN